MRRRNRRAARLAIVLTGAILAVAGLQAGGASPAAADGDAGKLVLLLDSSGSMKEKAADGKTRIAAAKTALNRVVDKLPDDANVGLRVYGATVFDRKDKGACKDTQLVVPIGTGNQAELKAAVKKYKPYGETPIAYSLEQAAKDLGSEGKRTILLVSDGEETCVPDPCPVAKKIAAAGIDLKIDVVGFNVSGKAEKQLKCVADKGNGDYYDADSTEDLEQSLEKLSTRAFRPFSLTGKPVAGTLDAASAPAIGPGDWVDKLPEEAEAVKYYRLRRTIPGSTFWVGTNLQPPVADTQLSMQITPVDDLDTTCGFAYPTALGSKYSKKLLTGVVSSFADSEYKKEDCAQPEEMMLSVGFTDYSEGIGNVPFQLKVYEEPPVPDVSGLPEASPDPIWEPMTPRNPQQIVPGSSFAGAPTAKPGTYSLDVMPGEIQVFKVKADWGQRIQVLAQTSKLAKADEWLSEGTRQYGVDVLSPLGGSAKSIFPEGGPTGSTSGISPRGNEVGVATKEIRYVNRTGGTDDDKSTGLAGEYFVTLRLDKDKADERAGSLPVTLTIDVLGEPKGAPVYDESGTAPSPTSTPTDEASNAPSDGPSASTPSADSSGPPSTEASSKSSPKPQANVEDSETPWLLIGGLGTGAVVLGGAGTAALVWLRRRP